MTFSDTIREAIQVGADPAVWVTMQLEQYRRCNSHCGHDLAHGVLVTDLLDRDQQDAPTDPMQ